MNKKSLVVLFVLLILPFFYVFFFLKAFFNPYNKIDNIPVAVVNLDDGYIGKQIIKSLKDSKSMLVYELNDDKIAENGVKQRKYYSSITIEKNTTKKLENLEQADILFRSNKKNNYIASQIYERVAIQIKSTLEANISKKASNKLHLAIDTSIKKTEVLKDGLNKLNDGSTKLYNGISTLDTKYTEFNNGIAELKNGQKEFNKGLKKYTDAVNKSADGLSQISNGVIKLADSLPILKISKDFNKLVDGAKMVKEQDVKKNLLEASNKLNDASLKLLEGSTKLENASLQVKDGLDKLQDGEKALNNGLNLASSKLNSSFNNAKNESNKIKNLDTFLDNSINLKIENIDDVPNYGSVFAPYFISISLWVGSLVIMVAMYYDTKNRFAIFDRANKNELKQFFSYLGLILLQSLIVATLIIISFNFELINTKIFYLSTIIVNFTFFSIVYFLINAFEDIGKFLAIILLIIQISASAGTFPIETAPYEFNFMYNLIPMKYSIGLFKESLAGFDYNFFLYNFKIFAIILLVFLILNILNIKRRNFKI